MYLKLEEIFQTFHEEYFTNNGFDNDKKFDDNKIFRLFVYKEIV